MAIGTQPTVGGLNANFTSYATQLRNLMTNMSEDMDEILALGQAGLVTVGFGSADATAAVNMAGVLNTVSGLYFGTATQATMFDFESATEGLWAGN